MSAPEVELAEVPVAELCRFARLLGGIPGGSGAPWSVAGKPAPLSDLLDVLERDLENVRRICADYDDDRQELAQLHRDLAGFRRVLGIPS